MTDLIILAVLAVIVAAAVTYIYKQKKSGAKCIGCSAAGGCSHEKTGCTTCGCGCHPDQT